MKKSSSIQLLLMTGLLTSCAEKSENSWGREKTAYLRSDTTASYTRTGGFYPGIFWYHAFRPFGYMGANGFQRGYYNGSLNPASNYGNNAYKGKVVRGGLGRSGIRASS